MSESNLSPSFDESGAPGADDDASLSPFDDYSELPAQGDPNVEPTIIGEPANDLDDELDDYEVDVNELDDELDEDDEDDELDDIFGVPEDVVDVDDLPSLDDELDDDVDEDSDDDFDDLEEDTEDDLGDTTTLGR